MQFVASIVRFWVVNAAICGPGYGPPLCESEPRSRDAVDRQYKLQSQLTHDGPLIVIQKRRRRLLVGRVAVVVVGPDT
jgi:hypothetical protein